MNRRQMIAGIFTIVSLVLVFKFMSYFTFETIGGDDSDIGTAVWTGIEDEGWIWILIFMVWTLGGMAIAWWYNDGFVEGDQVC